MVPDEFSRATYETRARGAMLAYTCERAETVNPETQCAFFFHGATNSVLASTLRMSFATALAEPLGETDRSRSDPFFFFEQVGRTRVSCREPSYREINHTAINQLGE
ncbi:hypothetical protein ALC57_11290 [Trachymyrmex cornetzi]|uniref:Uncharacterized protein n=1 Tax=Trachymyrmex cornetzi TaxID=471704 RepID=A0A195DU35_9HYME|nr:hypothetical protein ALC57_11290 [Trachymyrmex cornetzi]